MYFQSLVVFLTLFSAETVTCRSLFGLRNYYKPASEADGDVRSPCPALNTLANHGYLPRNGKAITPDMLTSGIQNIYNVDSFLGYTLGHLSIPLVENNTLTATTLDLDHLNLHDAIEHDASLSRNDFSQGDNHSLQPELLEALLNDAEGDSLTAESLAKSRARREKESVAKGAPPLGTKASSLAYGESALLLQAFGVPSNDAVGKLKASKAAVKTWFRDEKLPAGYVKPANPISFTSTSSLSNSIQSLAKQYKTKPRSS